MNSIDRKRFALVRLGAATLVALAGVSLLALGLAPAVVSHAQPQSPATTTLVVNDEGDGTLCNPDPFFICSLRGAIRYANAHPLSAPFSIHFDPAVKVISLTAPLPAITQAGTLVDSNAGLFSGTLLIVDGSGMSGGDMFTLNADDVALSGLALVNAPNDGANASVRVQGGHRVLISHNVMGTTFQGGACNTVGVNRNSSYGVVIESGVNGSNGFDDGSVYLWYNVIGCHAFGGVRLAGARFVRLGQYGFGDLPTGNFIGVNWVNGPLANGGAGVLVEQVFATGAHDNLIVANQIAGNSGDGIHIYGGSSDSNRVISNTIGTNAAGSAALGNTVNGVYVDVAPNSVISGNVISGNGYQGIVVSGANNSGIFSNRIGVNRPGTAAVGNGLGGIALLNGATNTLIGGNAAQRNVIGGNGGYGVYLRDGGTSNNRVEGNFIGLNAAGTAAIGNAGTGVYVDGAPNNAIGATLFAAPQYIGGNRAAGIAVYNASGTSIGFFNRIGVGSDDATPTGNGMQGVVLYQAAGADVEPAIVANNSGSGIGVVGSLATGNVLLPGAIQNNGGLPIDLGDDGFTPNGAHVPPGPNNWLPYPLVSAYSASTLTGTACASCSVHVYRALGNPSGRYGGGNYLADVAADGSGKWTYALPAGTSRFDITLSAEDGAGNTSEFSPRGRAYLPAVMR